MIKNLIKLGLFAALMYFLASKGFLSLEKTRAAFDHPGLTWPALIGLVCISILGSVRWQWLLRAQGIELPWKRVIQLTYVGNFFNIALPGAVSGDVIKAFYIGKEMQSRKGRAFGTILFDRLAGLSALVVVSAGALLLDIGALYGTPLFTGVKLIVLGAAAAVIVFYAYLFLLHPDNDPVMRLLKHLASKKPKAESLVRIYEGVRHYHDHRGTVVKVLALSIAIHITVGFICHVFLRALGDGFVELFPVFVVFPLGLLVTAVPIAPAGMGTGHAGFTYLFHLLGSERGGDLYTLYAMAQLMVGAIGGLVYLRFKAHEPEIAKEALEPTRDLV